MLGKLMKYDNRAIGRILLPVYGGMILLALLNNLVRNFWDFGTDDPMILKIFQVITMVAYVLVIFVAIFTTVFTIVSRFYKDMTRDEGYLTHTLPVGSSTLLGAKLLSGSLWLIIGLAAGIASVFCLIRPDTLSAALRNFGAFVHQVILILEEAKISWVPYLVEFILLFVLTIPESLLAFYLAIAIGNLANNHRVLAAIGVYTLIGIAKQTVYTLLGIIAEHLEWQTMTEMSLSALTALIVVSLVFSVASFFVTRFLFRHKLNLA